jgi:hypothetical protein
MERGDNQGFASVTFYLPVLDKDLPENEKKYSNDKAEKLL